MKKTFKDFVASDITSVFVVADEFAETAVIEGVEMQIVMDANGNVPGDKKNQVAQYDILFHVAADYFTDAPQTDNVLNFNGEDYFIRLVNEEMGMYTIGLTRNKS